MAGLLARALQLSGSKSAAYSTPLYALADRLAASVADLCSTSYATSSIGSLGGVLIARCKSTTAGAASSSSDNSHLPRTDDPTWQWKFVQQQGHTINPCNSPLHPAVEAGIPPSSQDTTSVQEAYTPGSQCFGCGPAHPEGLGLRSLRTPQGLEATVVISSKYCAFPGIVNGGIISTLLDCHGNWTAAISLMDRACLPKPPLTLTSSILVKYIEPTPPDTELTLRSRVASTKEGQAGSTKTTVEVEVGLFARLVPGAAEKLLAVAHVVCKKQGALRAL